MDLHAVIPDLQAEKQILERTIAAMESLTSSEDGHHRSTRGRKSMGEAERRRFSGRMKRYWARETGRSLQAGLPWPLREA